MLFNSPIFILGLMPLVLTGFALAYRARSYLPAACFLVLASYVFYGWAEPRLVLLLAGSTVLNYGCGRAVLSARRGRHDGIAASAMWFGIAADLAFLGYFKYANFFMANLDALAGVHLALGAVALPVGISFYSFTQIAYLVDAAQGRVLSTRFADYALFVSYFPHLVAGPIIHHREMIPQFRDLSRHPVDLVTVAAGATLFALGLAKKVLVADNVARFADATFGASAAQGAGLADGWCGALAYSFQIYFDFSGYSDMAMGLSLLFGVRLPLNFASPYKSLSMIEFWGRWHMTLSRFLRDYLYIPLGGNRRGELRRYANLMVTMLLGGLWHGAGWTFVVWGGLHGVFLAANHLLRKLRPQPRPDGTWRRLGKRAVVFALVTIAWVPFRAQSLGDAVSVLKGMAGLAGFGTVTDPQAALRWMLFCLFAVWCLPNSYEIFATAQPALPPRSGLARRAPALLSWRPNAAWAAVGAGGLVASILVMNKFSPFLYFRF